MQFDVSAIVQGYAQGYFLMADETGDRLGWYSSRDRAMIPLDDRFRYPNSLQRILNSARFTVAVNRETRGVKNPL